MPALITSGILLVCLLWSATPTVKGDVSLRGLISAKVFKRSHNVEPSLGRSSQTDTDLKTNHFFNNIVKRALSTSNDIGGANENAETPTPPTVVSNEISYSEGGGQQHAGQHSSTNDSFMNDHTVHVVTSYSEGTTFPATENSSVKVDEVDNSGTPTTAAIDLNTSTVDSNLNKTTVASSANTSDTRLEHLVTNNTTAVVTKRNVTENSTVATNTSIISTVPRDTERTSILTKLFDSTTTGANNVTVDVNQTLPSTSPMLPFNKTTRNVNIVEPSSTTTTQQSSNKVTTVNKTVESSAFNSSISNTTEQMPINTTAGEVLTPKTYGITTLAPTFNQLDRTSSTVATNIKEEQTTPLLYNQTISPPTATNSTMITNSSSDDTNSDYDNVEEPAPEPSPTGDVNQVATTVGTDTTASTSTFNDTLVPATKSTPTTTKTTMATTTTAAITTAPTTTQNTTTSSSTAAVTTPQTTATPPPTTTPLTPSEPGTSVNASPPRDGSPSSESTVKTTTISRTKSSTVTTTGKPGTTSEPATARSTPAPWNTNGKMLTSEWQTLSTQQPEHNTSTLQAESTELLVTTTEHTANHTIVISTKLPPMSNSTTIRTTLKSSPKPTPHTSTETSVPEPSGEPTTEPEPEGESEMGEKENSVPESEGIEPKGEPELNFDAFAEPGPDWVLAKVEWQEAWEFHVYFFGICFVVLGLYCVASVLRLWYMDHLLSRHYFLTLHLLVIAVCVLRSLYLLIDAYNSLGSFPVVVDYFLYNTVFPCITASFSILFYAILLATRVRVISQKIQKLWVLIFIISVHFTISIVTDLVVGLLSTAAILIFICQTVFILWGLVMFIGYLIVFRKLYKGALNRQKNMKNQTPDRKHNTSANSGTSDKNKHKYTFGLAVKITFMSAFFGVAIVGFELYGMFGVYGVLRPEVKPQPWPWWTYHFIVRTLELLMCFSVAYVASQPLRYTARKDASVLYHYLLPCNAFCCSDNLDISYDSSSLSMENVSDMDHLSWLKKIRNKKSPSHAPYPPHTAEKYSDPDATLLVRKIKQPKPSMLVVEDGFVRIRRDDEMMPSNQYELDSNSQSSQSSGLNFSGPSDNKTNAPQAVVNYNYGADTGRTRFRENMPLSFSLDNYRLPSIGDYNRDSILATECTEDTDIDIEVTDSEHSDLEAECRDVTGTSPTSDKSGDIFRPLSMIDLAASMESELDRAFHSNGMEENMDPTPCDIIDKHEDSNVACNLNDSDASDSDQSKASSARLLRSPVRRCKSEEKPGNTGAKSKMFDKHRYYSLSNVESIGTQDCSVDKQANVELVFKRS